jgi:addiction module HigA family antidote
MEGRMARKLPPLHPGEVLREEFLLPLEMSAGALAKTCGVPRTRIERLANEQIGVTADTALRLSKAFGTTPELWLNLQNSFDVQTARSKIADELARIEPVKAA